MAKPAQFRWDALGDDVKSILFRLGATLDRPARLRGLLEDASAVADDCLTRLGEIGSRRTSIMEQLAGRVEMRCRSSRAG